MVIRTVGRGKRATKVRRKKAGGAKRSTGGAKKPGAKARKGVPEVKRKKGAGRQGSGAAQQKTLWPKRLVSLGRIDGCGAGVIIAERTGKESETVGNVGEFAAWGKGGESPRRGGKIASGGGGATRTGSPRISAATCRALAAVGHDVRARLMIKMLEGPATYRALQRATGQKAGPLYHHINQLRLAGLILPKQRDLYELTRGGRNLILTVAVVGPLLRDARRRPQAVK